EIGFPQEPAIGTHKRVDLVSNLAFVESVAPFLANQSERSRQIWVLEDVAFTGRATVSIWRRRALAPVNRFIGPGAGRLHWQGVGLDKRSGQSFVEARTKRPVVRDQIGDRKTFLGIANRRGEIVSQFQCAEFFV